MTEIIAVTNQKGGVGKTTTVVNVAAYAALAGRKVLVVDCDPQGNCSSVLAAEAGERSVYSGQQPQTTAHQGLDIIAGGADLVDHEQLLARQPGGQAQLSALLDPYRLAYDIIFIDCPPSLAILPVNALRAATSVLVPLQCEYYAMEGLGQLMQVLQAMREEPRLLGVALTMYEPGLPLASAVRREIESHFGDSVFGTPIRRDVALAAAPSHGKTILAYNPLAPGALDYCLLTEEVLNGCQ
jgi:chromosome partitioning protein